jgi:hypothetical protein
VIVGRRGGKSRFGGALAVRAGIRRYRLAPGERAGIAIAAADRDQARVLLGYAVSPFQAHEELRGRVRRGSVTQRLVELVTRRTRRGIDLVGNISIEVRTSHFATIRGRTIPLALADELAFWSADDGSNPASKILPAIRPSLMVVDGTPLGQLVGISSPHAKSGPLWEMYERYYGLEDAPVLVWKAPTTTMNPAYPERLVQEALQRDEARARAEWLAEFRDDLSGYISSDALRAVVDTGRGGDAPLAASPDVDYLAFVDAATGSGSDSMTLAIAHVEQEPDGRFIAVVDRVQEVRPPFNPEDVTRDFAALVRACNITTVHGDRFAAGWTEAAFARSGVKYEPSPLSKSEISIAMLSLINSRQVELPDIPRLVTQLSCLQRRVGSGGRETVDHAPRAGAHDDLANCAAGAAVLVHRMISTPRITPVFV